MIDIELIRNKKEIVKQSEIDRFRDPSVVDEIFELDLLWRKRKFELDRLKKEMNKFQKQINDIVKANKKKSEIIRNEKIQEVESKLANSNINDLKLQKNAQAEKTEDVKSKIESLNINDLTAQRNAMKDERDFLEQDTKIMEDTIQSMLSGIGNILNKDVVISNNEDDNKLIYDYQSKREIIKKYHYHELFDKIEGCDTLKGAAIAGHRGYYLYEDLALLGMALTKYSIDFMRERGYKFVQTPVMMNKESMARTAQLSDFDDQLYKLENDFYLIATSEQPLTCLHMDEFITDLPIKYVGHSLCFRKEAGAHGKDNQGIFRVHQFEKVEQFVICDSNSDLYFDEMIGNVRALYESLDISHRVVSIVSKELNDAASIKYDLECYFPMTDRYRELVSCSNCTDYQSRSLRIRLGFKKEDGKKFVHMLNCTVMAVQRMLCCLVENCQNERGIEIPKVLVKYFGKDMIEYKK